jgi:hypothetical protein
MIANDSLRHSIAIALHFLGSTVTAFHFCKRLGRSLVQEATR